MLLVAAPRAAYLTGLYPHSAGVGHMLQSWHPPSYTAGILPSTATFAELLHAAGYHTYHVGKWHVGGAGNADEPNHPLHRGFEHAFGTAGGGGFFDLQPLYDDRQYIKPPAGFYATDAFTDHAVSILAEHGHASDGQPFALELCYTAPDFPLHALPEDIAKYRGKYRDGWDRLRERRFARQKELGLLPESTRLSPRDPVAQPWDDVPESDRDEWDLRMAVYAAMIDRMDQGIGRVLATIDKIGAQENTLVLFFSDNGASAEALDSWPNPARGHRPGTATGAGLASLPGSWLGERRQHPLSRAQDVGARRGHLDAAGGLLARRHRRARGLMHRRSSCDRHHAHAVGSCGHDIPRDAGRAQVTAACRGADRMHCTSAAQRTRGASPAAKCRRRATLAWEHEGNRAIRLGDWKLVAPWRGPWELYNLAQDRAETSNMVAVMPGKVRQLAAAWQAWADQVGVVPWDELPGANYKPSPGYRKKSEAATAQ